MLHAKLVEFGDDADNCAFVLDALLERFDDDELDERLTCLAADTATRRNTARTIANLRGLARSSYELAFPARTSVSERVLWPQSAIESQGMEDARSVRFTEDDGRACYFGTYTAFAAHRHRLAVAARAARQPDAHRLTGPTGRGGAAVGGRKSSVVQRGAVVERVSQPLTSVRSVVGITPVDNRTSVYQRSSMVRRAKRLPAASLQIVLALLDGELHGYALIRRVADLSDGMVKMGPGTLYGTLNRLVTDGLITETTQQRDRADGDRRRYYELTAHGRQVAVDEYSRLRTLVERLGGLPGASPA